MRRECRGAVAGRHGVSHAARVREAATRGPRRSCSHWPNGVVSDNTPACFNGTQRGCCNVLRNGLSREMPAFRCCREKQVVN